MDPVIKSIGFKRSNTGPFTAIKSKYKANVDTTDWCLSVESMTTT